MTMHLLPAFVTTTSTRTRKSSNSKRTAMAKADHLAWVQSMTGGKKSDQKVLDKIRKEEYTKNMVVDRSKYVSAGMTSAVCSKVETKTYSGERKLLGIATMHKSNMVPVFAKSDAEDIAKMRRG